MRKILKSKIFLIIVTALIFTGVGATASIVATNITYNPSWTKTNGDPISTASEAMDELYTRVNKYDSINISFYAQSYINSVNSNAGLNLAGYKDGYKYFEIEFVNINSGAGTCTLVAWNGSSVNITKNTRYETKDFSTIYVRAKSSTNDTSNPLQCVVGVKLYNKIPTQ